MIRNSALKLALVGALSITAMVGLAVPRPAFGQAAASDTMTVVVETPPSDLDPASSYDENSNIPLRAMYEGLVTLKGDSLTDVVPVLAASYTASTDNKTYIFTLRSGVTFHDGTVFDATAAKFGLTRTVKDKLGTSGILGTFLTDPDKQITVIDAQTLQVAFSTPQPSFLLALAASYGTGFVSPTAVKAHIVNGSDGKPDDAHTWLQTHEAGTGPYTMTDVLPSTDAFANGKTLVMKQFGKYWQGWSGSHFQQVVIKLVAESTQRRQALENGTADAATVLLPTDITKLTQKGPVQIDKNPTLRIDYLIMGAGYGPLKSIKARQAMCYAFDYAAYNRAELGGLGLPAKGPFPNTLLGWDTTMTAPCATDLKMAVSLLKNAGVAPGTVLKFAALQGRGDNAAAILKQQLEQIGLELQITKYSSDDFNNTLIPGPISTDRPDFILNSWWPDYNNPLNYSLPLFYSKSTGSAGQNAGYYNNKQVDQIIELAQKTSDQTALITLFKPLQTVVAKDDPAGIFMAQSPDRTVVSSAIKNQVFNVLYLGTFDFYALSKG
jgi:peptide/nickel transport system substrate-binding protein